MEKTANKQALIARLGTSHPTRAINSPDGSFRSCFPSLAAKVEYLQGQLPERAVCAANEHANIEGLWSP